MSQSLKDQLIEEDDSSSGSSTESESEDEAVPVVAPAPVAPLPAAAQKASPSEDPLRTSAKDRWKKAGNVVRAQVAVKRTFGDLYGTKRLERWNLEEKEKNRFVAMLFMIAVFLNIMDTESKACAFHSSAVGLYSVDGKPYKFTYSLFVALIVFIMKLLLGPIRKLIHHIKTRKLKQRKTAHPQRPSSHSHQDNGAQSQAFDSVTSHVAAKQFHKKGWLVYIKTFAAGKSAAEIIMPWFLLIAFTLLEMMSATLANYALTRTPTSIFIVFKSAKMVIVSIAERIFFAKKLLVPQWTALVLMVISLLIATVAEEKGGKKGGGMSLQGPLILLLSEFCYACMLILQQIAVRDYWPDPLALVSASAALGIPLTLTSMVAAHKMTSPLPPYHPVSDPVDVFVMCSNSLPLTLALLGHVGFRVSLDAFHISSAKYMSALARAMTDVVKLAIMWVLGKTLYLLGYLIWQSEWPKQGGTLAVLSEPWHPNSWMMIPGLFLIGYALLMFRFRVFAPIQIAKGEDGKYFLHIVEAEKTAEEKANGYNNTDANMDDTFYSAAFTNRRVRANVRQRFLETLAKNRAVPIFQEGAQPVNKWQTGVLKLRASQSGSQA